MAQEIFKRVEEKWLLPKEEYRRLLPELRKHMEEDVYGKYTISNIYYDTTDFRLIRDRRRMACTRATSSLVSKGLIT